MIFLNPSVPETELLTFFAMTPDLVCIANREGYFKSVNQAVIDKLGYSRQELFSRPIASFIFNEDKMRTSSRRDKLLKGTNLLNFENRYVKKDGGIVWLEWSSIYIADREVVFAIAKDITARKEMESEIEKKIERFTSLANHFKNCIEEDRKQLAKSLHEDLAQLAAVVKMDIEWINEQAAGLGDALQARTSHALKVALLLLQTIRRISFSISPVMLNDLGLPTTLEWQCEEFTTLHGIPARVDWQIEEERLTEEIKTDFFRIAQEALTHTLDHKFARDIVIRLHPAGERVRLIISDEGKGFERISFTETPSLVRIRDRALSINGRLHIESRVGAGSSIVVTV